MKEILSKNVDKLKTFAISFAYLFVVYSVFMNQTFTSDAVGNFPSAYDYMPDFKEYLAGGRFASYFINIIAFLLNKLHISKYSHQSILQLWIIVMISVSICIIYEMFKEHDNKKDVWLISLIISAAFINPYFVETFVYIAFEWGIGILLAILGVYAFNKKHYIISFCMVFLSASVYQSFIAIFLIYSTTVIYLKAKGRMSKNALLEGVIMAVIAAMSAVVNIIMVKASVYLGIIEQEIKSVSGGITLQKRWDNVREAYDIIIHYGYGMIPEEFLYRTFWIVSIIIIIGIAVKSRSINKVLTFIMFGILLNLYFVAIFVLTDPIWPVQRMVWPCFCSISCLFFVAKNSYENKYIGLGMLGGFAVFMCVVTFGTSTCITDFFISNKLDVQYIYFVENEIQQYEERTGNKINTIVVRKSDGSRYCSEELINEYDSCTYSHRALYDSWSDVALLKYLTGRSCKRVEMSDEIYDKYFPKKYWDGYVPSEQLRFENNVLYWVIY